LEEWSQRSRIEVDFHSRGFDAPGSLAQHVEITIYRIVQEALTNVLKHADAHLVSVLLERRRDHVLAVVEDDGQGFDAEAGTAPSQTQRGLGLSSMRERAELVGGSLAIESSPGQGTAVFLRIPLHPSSRVRQSHE
jgi:signal transduction histidine kinase